jgi:putative phage-type endonuclease
MIKKIKTKDRQEWLDLRRGYIGGSDAATIVGLNPFSSKYALWAEKKGLVPPFEGNLATDVGTYLEEFIAKRFEQETGKKVRRENASILNDQYPFAIANVDRVIVGEDAGLEIKSTSSLSLSRFKNGEYPARYYVQCVHYLAVAGKKYKRWYLAVLIGNTDFKVFTIERDENEINALMTAEKAFWDNHVIANIPPEIDSSEQTSKAIECSYEEDDSECDLTDLDEDIEDLLDIKKQIKTLDVLKSALENKIKNEMGGSRFGRSSLANVSWASQERRSFDAKSFARAYPQINLDSFYKTSTSRIFRVKEIGE